MTIRKRILVSAIATALAGLAACGGSSTGGTQDVGSTQNADGQGRVLYARVVDGYLAGATVFVDHNANGTLDAFETRAITDGDGFFSYNHVTSVDYCASSTPQFAQHCLRTTSVTGEATLIRVTGGYDTVTGLPFKGILSLRSNEMDRDDLRLVTPQTSIAAAIDDATAQQKFDALVRAGLLTAGGSLDEDHIEGTLSAQAVRAQMATVLVRALGIAADASLQSHSFEDVESSAWHAGYAAIARQLVSEHAAGGSGAFGDVFSSAAAAKEVVRDLVFSKLNPTQTMPAQFTLPNEASVAPVLQFSASLVAFSEELIEAMQRGALTDDEFRAGLRVLAIASERGLKNPADAELADLFAWVRNQLAQGHGLGSDLSALGGRNVDLSTLIAPSFDFEPTSNSISAAAIIPSDAANAFAAIVNTSFPVEVSKADQQGAGLIYFVGENGARTGELKLCVRYRDAEGDFDTGSVSDPNGAMLLNGRWSLLNDHSLTLSVDVVGGVRPLMLKSVRSNGAELTYRFDFDGDPEEWTGAAPSGFATGAVPASDAECKQSLIERFGSIG